jgi:TPR repeat protein
MRATPVYEAQENTLPVEDGFAAFERGDYASALKFWKPLAEQGDSLSQTLIGAMYHYGKGVRQNDAEAVKWLNRAAERGNARGQTLLGLLYAMGKGVERNSVSAYMWLDIAATWNIEEALSGRDRIAREMATNEIIEAVLLAHKWMINHQH